VFNIKGNDYRLVTALAYNTGLVFIKFVGTHAEYDRINAETVEKR
jgi:mRNA interferase HigB